MNTLVGPDVTIQHLASMLIFGGLVLPMCFKRQLSELRFVSLGVVMFCFCASAVVAFKSMELVVEDGSQNSSPGDFWVLQSPSAMLDITPVVAFGFSSIAELFHVRAEIKKVDNLGRCAHIATLIVVGLYLLIGVVGTLAFQDPGPNVLQNFPDSHVVSVFRLVIIVMVTLLYPIINFPCMQAVDALIAGRFGTPSMWRWKLEAIIGLVLVLIVNTFITDLDAVFGLCGSLGLGLIAYVFPCAAALAVARQGSVASAGDSQARPVAKFIRLSCATVVLAIGLVLTVGSTASIIYGVFQSK